MRIGTWNVCTLRGLGKGEQLAIEMEHNGLMVLGGKAKAGPTEDVNNSCKKWGMASSVEKSNVFAVWVEK